MTIPGYSWKFLTTTKSALRTPAVYVLVRNAELLADYFKKRKALDHEIDKTLAEIQRILGIEINIEE